MSDLSEGVSAGRYVPLIPSQPYFITDKRPGDVASCYADFAMESRLKAPIQFSVWQRRINN